MDLPCEEINRSAIRSESWRMDFYLDYRRPELYSDLVNKPVNE